MIDPTYRLTEEAMTRPLFEPLSEEHERPDEWSEPFGFVMGGMATYLLQTERYGALAEQYFNAATALIDDIAKRRIADCEVANAALFLYRHCFELLLKAGLPDDIRAKKKHHHLGNLAKSYAYHKRQAGYIVPLWVVKRCEELASIDPSSETFRYGEHSTPNGTSLPPITDEIHVDLRHLRAAMLALNTALVSQNWLIRMAQGGRP